MPFIRSHILETVRLKSCHYLIQHIIQRNLRNSFVTIYLNFHPSIIIVYKLQTLTIENHTSTNSFFLYKNEKY